MWKNIDMRRRLSSSTEDYLEALLDLSEEHGPVRVTDIARRLSIAKPSVNEAMRLLKEKGFISQERYGRIHLTDQGSEEAVKVRRRHTALRAFLRDILGVTEEMAEKDACQMEHAVSPETMDRLQAFLERTMMTH